MSANTFVGFGAGWFHEHRICKLVLDTCMGDPQRHTVQRHTVVSTSRRRRRRMRRIRDVIWGPDGAPLVFTSLFFASSFCSSQGRKISQYAFVRYAIRIRWICMIRPLTVISVTIISTTRRALLGLFWSSFGLFVLLVFELVLKRVLKLVLKLVFDELPCMHTYMYISSQCVCCNRLPICLCICIYIHICFYLYVSVYICIHLYISV